jgi:hypothetical protein
MASDSFDNLGAHFSLIGVLRSSKDGTRPRRMGQSYGLNQQ